MAQIKQKPPPPQQKSGRPKEIEDFDAKLKPETPEEDEAILSKEKANIKGEEDKSELSKEEKQEILHKATAKAAGWAVLFNVFDTLYYGLRKDETVAKRFDLDEEKDKDFIKQIKREQTKATIPAAISIIIPSIGIQMLPRLLTYVYQKTKDPAKFNVKEN